MSVTDAEFRKHPTFCDTFWGTHGCSLEPGHEGFCICDDRELDEDGQPIGELQDLVRDKAVPAVPPYNGPDTWWHSNHDTPTPPQTLRAWRAAMMPKIHFPEDQGTRIEIKPMSFDVAQRVEASAIATEKGVGLRMEVHSSHTEFWTDKTVPVGQVSVWMSKTYKGFIEPETVLESPETPWVPSTWSETMKALAARAQDSETNSAE